MFVVTQFNGRDYVGIAGVYYTFEEALQAGSYNDPGGLGMDGAQVVSVRGGEVIDFCYREYGNPWTHQQITRAREQVHRLGPVSQEVRWAYQILAGTVEGRACTDAIKEAFRL